MKRVSKFFLCAAASALFQISTAPNASAAPILGANLATFAVLGATGVTNVATTTVSGNVGSSPNGSVDGGFVFNGGSVQADTAIAQAAQLELDQAILDLNNSVLVGPAILLGSGDLTLLGPIAPGNYIVPNASTNITGALVLDGGGDSNAVWIFHFPSTTFITSTTSTVTVQDVGTGAGVGVYWDVGTSATLNGLTLVGNVLAGQTITSDGNLTLTCGRLLADNGAVTLIQDNINNGCASIGEGGGGEDSGGGDQGNPVPEPGTLALLGTGIAGWIAQRRRSAR